MTERSQEHPRLRLLLDRRDGVLTGARATEVGSHVDAGCTTCATTVAEINGLVADIAAGPLPAPPAALMKRAHSLFAAGRRRAVIQRAQRVIASLLFDEWLQPVPALRSAVGTERRLLFATERYEVFVSVVRGVWGWELDGQVLPTDDDGESSARGEVWVRSGMTLAGHVRLDSEGGFRVEKIPAGEIGVEMKVGGEWIAVPPFHVTR